MDMNYTFNLLQRVLFIFVILVSFTACHEEEKVFNPKYELSGWGYFYGEINGKQVLLENHDPDYYISYIDFETFHYTNACRIQLNTPYATAFSIYLMMPSVGTRYIANNSFQFNYHDYNYDNIVGFYDDSVRYELKAGEPAKVDITNIEYKGTSPWVYIIEGDIDAVLYKDGKSISIKGHFATKW